MFNNTSATNYTAALQAAALAQCDPRTALRAIELGLDSIRSRMTRARLARAFAELGIEPKTGKVAA